MNTILKSLAAIVAVGAVAGGATFAYFSDTETISGNTFTAGTLDLKLDQAVSSSVQKWVDGFDISSPEFRQANGWSTPQYNEFMAQSGLKDLKPGDVKEQIIDVKSDGTVSGGVVTIDLNRTSELNDLAKVLEFEIKYDNDNNGTFKSTGIKGTVDQFNKAYDLGAINNTNGIASVKIIWSVPTSAGNEIMGDSVTINTVFGLNQVVNQVN